MDDIEVFPGTRISRHHALFLEDEGLLVIADLHLGYEGALLEQGVSIPRFQKNVMLERLKRLIDKYSPSTILIDGDFKHEFSKNLVQEWQEVNEVLDFVSNAADVRLVRGNHDNFLMTILSKKGLDLLSETSVGGYSFAHGDREVSWDDILVMGHEHPSLGLRDRVGATAKLPCFLVTTRLIVLPAFSPLALGTDVTTLDFISPPLSDLNPNDGHVYAIEEKTGLLDFGKLKDVIGA
ncbi:MAG: metallophosphoesterase [Thermoplasmata archaeon]